VELRGIEPLTS